MKPNFVQAVVAVLAAGVLAPAASAQDLEPGLWEVTSRMASESGELEKGMAEMQKHMAAMPPEQRKMMEDMMARHDVRMGGGEPGEMVAKICMTPEMIERNEMPVQQGKCESTTRPRVGDTVEMSFACTDPPSSGEGQFTILSPESYTSKVVVRTTAQGRPETMNIDASGKWIDAECGSIEPMSPAAR